MEGLCATPYGAPVPRLAASAPGDPDRTNDNLEPPKGVAAGMAGRVAAGAGWPGRTEILSFRRWAWVCHRGLLSVQAPDNAPKRGPGQHGLRVGANLLCPNLDGNQVAWKYRTCAGYADLLFREGGNRSAGIVIVYIQFTSSTELSLRAARESGHNSMCQKGLRVLLRATVRDRPIGRLGEGRWS